MTVGADVSTYSVGDYVYTKPGSGRAPQLARIESAHALQSNSGQLWLVRLRMRAAWASAPIHRPIDRALAGAEVAHCRRLGLIPPASESI